MAKLESITGETCVKKVMAMRNLYLTLEEEKTCRNNCENGYNPECPNYVSIKSTSIPIRQGRFAYLR